MSPEYMKKFLFTFFILVSSAHADTQINVRMHGNYRFIRETVKAANAYTVGFPNRPNFKIIGRAKIRTGDADMENMYGTYSFFAKKRKSRATLYIINPGLYNGVSGYTGGLASVCNPSFGTGLVWVSEYNSSGQPRATHAAVTLAHETGHIMGASHDQQIYLGCKSLMHGGVLADVGRCPIDLSLRSWKEMERCRK